MTEDTTTGPAPTGGFTDLADFFDGSLKLPWRGKTYVIPAPDYELGLRCQALVSVGVQARAGGRPSERDVEVLTDAQEVDLYGELLGPAGAELLDDGADWAVRRHFGLTALMFFTLGKEAAEAVWTGKAPAAPNRAARRAKAKGKGTGRKARPGSTAGTTAARKAKE